MNAVTSRVVLLAVVCAMVLAAPQVPGRAAGNSEGMWFFYSSTSLGSVIQTNESDLGFVRVQAGVAVLDCLDIVEGRTGEGHEIYARFHLVNPPGGGNAQTYPWHIHIASDSTGGWSTRSTSQDHCGAGNIPQVSSFTVLCLRPDTDAFATCP